MPTAGRGAPPPARHRHHHRRSVLLSWFHGRVVVSAVDETRRGRIMVVKRAVPISTLVLQSRVEHADAMATRRSRSSLRDDSRMVVASRRRDGHGRGGRRFAATKRSRSSLLRDDDIDDEVVMPWRSPLRGDETVAVVASRRDDGMMAVASRR